MCLHFSEWCQFMSVNRALIIVQLEKTLIKTHTDVSSWPTAVWYPQMMQLYVSNQKLWSTCRNIICTPRLTHHILICTSPLTLTRQLYLTSCKKWLNTCISYSLTFWLDESLSNCLHKLFTTCSKALWPTTVFFIAHDKLSIKKKGDCKIKDAAPVATCRSIGRSLCVFTTKLPLVG